MNYPKQHELSAAACQERFIKTHYPEFYNYLLENYPGVSNHTERMYWFYNNITEHPRCHCGKETKFLSLGRGYQKYCSSRCIGTDPDIIKKKKETSLSKYGTESPLKLEDVQNKRKKTCLERYGVDNVARTKDFADKRRKTCLERYGYEHHLQNPSIRDSLVRNMRKKNVSVDDNLIGYDEKGCQIRRCPHPECNKCSEKQYIIPPNMYYDRCRCGTELCTNILKINANHDSTLEHKIINLLDECGIKYKRNVRDIIPPKEIDIYIPDRHLAIECNGIWAHSSINNLDPKAPSYHSNKSKDCMGVGVVLIHLWEDWITHRGEVVKSMIMNKLGLSKRRIYARKCIIKHINSNEFRGFLDKNHIQGQCGSNIRYGLYYNGELVSVMGFSKKHDNKYELVRFCSVIYTNVIGGASKLFKAFIKQYSPSEVVSFSMNDFSQGIIYEKLGFRKTVVNQVYWYFEPKTLERKHRSSFTKQNIVRRGWKDDINDDWTETMAMTEQGYFKIYDSGQTKWVWNLNNS